MKTIKVTISNHDNLERAVLGDPTIKADDLIKDVFIEVPDPIIGVGIISVIDDMLDKPEYKGWTMTNYTEVKQGGR